MYNKFKYTQAESYSWKIKSHNWKVCCYKGNIQYCKSIAKSIHLSQNSGKYAAEHLGKALRARQGSIHPQAQHSTTVKEEREWASIP